MTVDKVIIFVNDLFLKSKEEDLFMEAVFNEDGCGQSESQKRVW
jgi:hypothetical protein